MPTPDAWVKYAKESMEKQTHDHPNWDHRYAYGPCIIGSRNESLQDKDQEIQEADQIRTQEE